MSEHKNHILLTITLLVIGWGLLVVVNALRADWSGPTEVPPGGNPSSFLTSGSNAETKTGPLTISNNFFVTGNVNLGSTSIPTSARLVIDPYTNASIDAGSGFIRTGYIAAHDYDVINKAYLYSSLEASSYWILSTSTNSLYPTSTSWKVGIGTTNPGTAKLAVMGGNVGIGTTNPGYRLSLGNPSADSSSSKIAIYEHVGYDNYFYGLGLVGGATETGLAFWGGTEGSAPSSTNVHLFIRRNSGNVGIGTISPGTYKLNVNGTANFANQVTVPTPTVSSSAATKAYVDSSAQSLWVNSGQYLYPTSTSWRVGIGTTSPIAALHIYPRTDTEGVRVVSSNYSPLVIRNSSDEADLFRVNQSGDVTAVTSSATRMRSNNYCDATGANCFDPSGGWSTASYFIGITSSSFNGNQGGYTSAHAKCNEAFSGSHVCNVFEILETIRSGHSADIPVNTIGIWISSGPPGYTANANDCMGYTSAATSDYGAIWVKLSANSDGYGSLRYCNQTSPFACCR